MNTLACLSDRVRPSRLIVKAVLCAAVFLSANSSFASIICVMSVDEPAITCASFGPPSGYSNDDARWEIVTSGNVGIATVNNQANRIKITCLSTPTAFDVAVQHRWEKGQNSTTWEEFTFRCEEDNPPPQPLARAEWEYCIGNTPVFHISWAAAPGTAAPVAFKLEQRVNFVWMPAYQGSGTHVTFGCPSRTYFRVKAITLGGSSPWRYFWAVKDCGSGSGFPD